MSTSSLRNRYFKQNLSVLFVGLSTAAILYISYDPIPAGSRPEEVGWATVETPAFLRHQIDDERELSENPDDTDALSGRPALLMQTRLLEKGLQEIASVSDYSATFVKQEKIDGVLSELDFLKIKVRQKPFSIYMKWLTGEDAGQEVAYVDGENNNRVLLKMGGLKGRMLPTLKISPRGNLAMSEARYPITEMGLKNLIERILEFRYRDLELSEGVNCRLLDERKIEQKDCHCFVVNYDNPDVSPKFRKSFIYINRETGLPVCVRNFGWPLAHCQNLTGKELDKETLLECYSYTDISTDDQLSAGAFELADSNR